MRDTGKTKTENSCYYTAQTQIDCRYVVTTIGWGITKREIYGVEA